MGQSIGCYKSLFRTEIMPKLKEKVLDNGKVFKPKYLMDKSDVDLSFEILRSNDKSSGWKNNRKSKVPFS